MTNQAYAFDHATNASEELNMAAQELGYEDVHELAAAARNDTLPDEVHKDAVRSITNAYSYLNNGGISHLIEE